MLILSRRCQEEIVLDEQIQVKVIKAEGGRVTVKVRAPAGVPILQVEQSMCSGLDCGPVLVSETEAVAS